MFLKPLGEIRQIPSKRAPFYPQAPGLGKRAAMGFLRWGSGEPRGRLGRGGRSSQGNLRMSMYFEELDFRSTAMGVLSLRRRKHLTSGVDVYEIKLGDEFLMSSLFTVAEIALARIGLEALERVDLDVVVGGLGLGYTALAALENPAVKSLIVVDALPEVIEWHAQ